MEERILSAEAEAEAAQARLSEASEAGDGPRIEEAYSALKAAEAEVERLYARWAELEGKVASI